jgi:hypothetical protein
LSFGHNLSLDQHRPGVDEVEGVGLKSRVSRVCADDLDVAQTPVGDQFECHSHVDRIGVEPNNPPARRDPFGQQLDDAARSAADVDGTVAWTQAKPVEQGAAVGCELVGLPLQPCALGAVAAERIRRVWVAACRHTRSGISHRGALPPTAAGAG